MFSILGNVNLLLCTAAHISGGLQPRNTSRALPMHRLRSVSKYPVISRLRPPVPTYAQFPSSSSTSASPRFHRRSACRDFLCLCTSDTSCRSNRSSKSPSRVNPTSNCRPRSYRRDHSSRAPAARTRECGILVNGGGRPSSVGICLDTQHGYSRCCLTTLIVPGKHVAFGNMHRTIPGRGS